MPLVHALEEQACQSIMKLHHHAFQHDLELGSAALHSQVFLELSRHLRSSLNGTAVLIQWAFASSMLSYSALDLPLIVLGESK